MQTTSNGDLIFSYTIDQATSDGILFDIRTVNPEWESGIFSHVITNLLSIGCFNDDPTVNVPNLLDLLNQPLDIVRQESKGFTRHNWLFAGAIELPSGSRRKIFIVQNETRKYTLMLPRDY